MIFRHSWVVTSCDHGWWRANQIVHGLEVLLWQEKSVLDISSTHTQQPFQNWMLDKIIPRLTVVNDLPLLKDRGVANYHAGTPTQNENISKKKCSVKNTHVSKHILLSVVISQEVLCIQSACCRLWIPWLLLACSPMVASASIPNGSFSCYVASPPMFTIAPDFEQNSMGSLAAESHMINQYKYE